MFGLALFFGLAFEEFHARQGRDRPGGVRTFPLLASIGAMLYLLDPTRLIPFSMGLLIVGAWLFAFYWRAVTEQRREPAACRPRRSRLQSPGLSAGTRRADAAALDGRRRDRRGRASPHRARASPRRGLADRAAGIRHRRQVPHPHRHHPASAAERARHRADDDNALPDLARPARRVHALLCELSPVALLGARAGRYADRRSWGTLFLDGDDRRAG